MRFLILALCVFFMTTYAVAESALRVTPNRIVINQGERSTVINLTNESGRAKAYRVSFETRHMREEGGTYVVENSPYSAAKMLRASPRRVILKDGERQVMRLQFRPKPGLEDGDYFTHIKFTQVPIPKAVEREVPEGKAAFTAETMVNVSVPVTVGVGKKNVKVEINNVEKVDDKTLIVHLKRDGNAQALGYFNGFIPSEEGQKEAEHVIKYSVMTAYRNLETYQAKVPLLVPYEKLKGKELTLQLNAKKSPQSLVLSTYKIVLP